MANGTYRGLIIVNEKCVIWKSDNTREFERDVRYSLLAKNRSVVFLEDKFGNTQIVSIEDVELI